MFGDVAFAQSPFASLGGNTFVVAQAESSSASEQAVASLAQYADQDESVTGQDSASASAILAALISELCDASASQTVLITASALQQESATAQAAQTCTAVINASRVEFVNASHTQTRTANMLATVQTQLFILDVIQGRKVTSGAVSESATAEETQSNTKDAYGLIEESATASVLLVPLRTANVFPTGVQLVVRIGNLVIWIPVNDTQDPNWQNIINAQSDTWVLINTPLDTGWTQIPS